STPEFTPQVEEVAGIIEVPAKDLFADFYLKMEIIETPSLGSVKAPVFDFQGNRVWGATALMLYEMRQIIGKIIS
ncbi:MAG: coenzyme A pyrophosphatase, partial [Flavobacteriaceae bacterium]|nr:coenzyme A pyrophosphatase [Flavobacteriaceae bacterium]